MRHGYLRDGLWENVYLLEFYGRDGNTVLDSFAFGVAPESEEITLSQRKTETKTFGGLVVDDYGADALKITLSGNTVNNELRGIYHTEKGMESLTGEEEIYKLKAVIEKYKRDISLMGCKILLYDLSKHKKRGKRKKTIESFCWLVFPGELKIKRSKDRPFVYTYSIEFTAISTESRISFGALHTIFNVDFNKAFIQIEDELEKLEKDLSFMKPAIEKIQETRRFVKACKDVAFAAVGGTVNAFQLLIDDAFTVGNTAFELYRETTGGLIPFVMNNMDFVAAMLIDLMSNVSTLSANLRSIATKEFYMPVGVFDDWRLAIDELDALAQLTCHSMQRSASAMAVTAKTEQQRTYRLEIGENTSITTYGSRIVSVTDGMSFESAAQEFYGDASKAFIIASANGCSSIDDVVARKARHIIIPILERHESHFNNKIIGLSGQRDNYGRDIALDEKGNILLNESGTDFTFVSGKKNLSQAILMRLQENIHKRVRLQWYGIKTSIPDSESAGAAYILSSIIATLNQEPRIKELLGVSFLGDGDVLKIDIDYKDLGGSQNSITGAV